MLVLISGYIRPVDAIVSSNPIYKCYTTTNPHSPLVSFFIHATDPYHVPRPNVSAAHAEHLVNPQHRVGGRGRLYREPHSCLGLRRGRNAIYTDTVISFDPGPKRK
jgi:hypothetical protein